MRKIPIAVLIITMLFLISCSRKMSPVDPASFTSTPVLPANTLTITAIAQATQTAAVLLTAGVQAQQTATMQAQATSTFVAQAAATAAAQQTATMRAQQTATAVVQQTAAAMAQQTATAQAQQTAAVIARQTATAQAIMTTTAIITAPYTAVVNVPGGVFTQENIWNVGFIHTISPFKMGKYEVTYDLWVAVYLWAVSNGYTFANSGSEGSGGISGAAPTAAKYEPVARVNWRDIMIWCNAYSQVSGLTPAYYTDAAYMVPFKDLYTTASDTNLYGIAGQMDNPYVKWSADGYRLPTEGEWQYAASYIDGSAWTPVDYASGATANTLDAAATGSVAQYYGNAYDATKNVGEKIPNALGIYDMSGNIYEFCWDWSGTHPVGPVTDYRGAPSGSSRVLKGGYFNGNATILAVTSGFAAFPYEQGYPYGFRVARSN